MFLSISLRLLMNLESLNSVESVGNLVRHRTAPIVIRTEEAYAIRFVPAISGEALAHGYQMSLVEEAKRLNLPLTEESERGEFLKFADDSLLNKYGISIPKSEAQIRKTETQIMLKDFICDVGGFLYAGDYPVKRTSLFNVGYMIPALEDIQATALEAQFHVRHSPSSMKQYQIPYNVEVGSAVYTFTFTISFKEIATPLTAFGERHEEYEELLKAQKENRTRAALSALASFITLLPFGAKKNRFLPNMEYLSAIATYSNDKGFVTSPGNSRNFIKDTVERANEYIILSRKIRSKEPRIMLIALDREGAADNIENVEVTRNPEAFARRIVEIVEEEIREKK
ncbi:MAG: type I-A CRISPR-associated protein Cas7/Csa2 [Ignisphaera sp.]